MNTPEQKPLREALRAQFQDERLDSAQLDALRARMSAAAPAEGGRGDTSADGPAQPGRRRLFAVAASVAATATVG
jgi:hypothetical protein